VGSGEESARAALPEERSDIPARCCFRTPRHCLCVNSNLACRNPHPKTMSKTGKKGSPSAKGEMSSDRELPRAETIEALSRFAKGVAHEFNNIFAIIIGYTDLTIDGGEISTAALVNLEVAREAAVRGADLVKKLHTFAAPHIAETKTVDLRGIVDQALRLCKKELTGAGISVAVKHSPTPVLAALNPALLLNVIMELITNARHSMNETPKKELTIRTGCEGGIGFGCVEDTGEGIAEENLGRIFEPFFTTKGALASGEVHDGKAHGLGLGLSMCHGIVKRHGGDLGVISQVGKGTCFTVYLPAAIET
jgi:signal transduction histidine kinase